MRGNRILTTAVIAVLAMGLGPPPAVAAGGVTQAPLPAELRVVESLLAGDRGGAVVAALSALGGDETGVRMLAEGAVAEQLAAVNDLDGDGLGDVLGLARTSRPAQGTALPELLTVTARSGITGAALWSDEVPGQTGVSVPTPDGILLVSYTTAGPGVVLHLTAFDGDGTVRFTRADVGVPLGAFPVQWPAYAGTLTQSDGSVAHLVQTLTYALVVGEVAEPGSLTAYVLSDADGSELQRLEQTGDGVPWARPAPDLDGDGAQEVLFTQSFVNGPRGTVRAVRTDGTQLWSTSAPFRSNGFVVLPGDADGDGVGDLAIGTGGDVGLLSGASGATLWELPIGFPAALGDVDADGRPDVGIHSNETGGFTAFTTLRSAYSADGRQLYREVDGFPIELGRGYEATITTYLTTDDLDGDGVQDIFHDFALTYSDDGEQVRDGGASAGRNGRRLWEAVLPMRLGARVQGPGADLAHVASNGSEAFVETLRGDSLTRIWRVGVPAPGGMVGSFAEAADLTGDGLGEVLVTVVTLGEAGAHVQHGFVLDGVDGSLLW